MREWTIGSSSYAGSEFQFEEKVVERDSSGLHDQRSVLSTTQVYSQNGSNG